MHINSNFSITTFTHCRSHKHCYTNKYCTHCNKHFPAASCWQNRDFNEISTKEWGFML